MPALPLDRLPSAARPKARRDIRAALQFHRDLAPGAVRKAAKFVIARGGVQPLDPSEDSFSANVEDGEEPELVRLSWAKPGDIRCGCPAMKRLGTCHHALAAFEFLFVELNRKDEPAPAQSAGTGYLNRLEALGARLTRDRRSDARTMGAGHDPWTRCAHAAAEVRYVLRHAERGDAASFRLEAQVRERSTDGAQGPWRTVPMTVELASEDESLSLYGDEHAQVAAIASGAPDADRAASADFGRTVALAKVSRILAPALLREAARAAPLLLRAGKEREPVALELALDGVARLELLAAEHGVQAWTIGGRIVHGATGETFAIQDVLAVSTDGLLALRPKRGPAVLALLDAPGARHVIQELRREPLVIPREDASMLASLSSVTTLVGQALQDAAFPIEPLPCLRIEAPVVQGKGAAMRCYIEFEYGGTRVAYDSYDEIVPCLDGRSVSRQRPFEDAAVSRFFELGGRRAKANSRTEHDATVAASRFDPMVMALVHDGWNVVAEDQLIRAASSVSVSVASGVDWFDLVGGFEFGEEKVSLPEVLRAANQRRHYVTLGDGSRGILPEAWLDRWRLASLGEPLEDEETVRFDQSQAWILSSLVEEVEAEIDDPFARLRSNLGSLQSPSAAAPPDSFNGTLRPYQQEGLGWLKMLDRVGLSGCLADDMGLGKTVQMLAYLLHRRELSPGSPSLVVAPRSLIFNWIAEAKKFAPSIHAVDFSGAGRWERKAAAPVDALLVTTYGSLRRDAVELAGVQFDVVVLDEAQAIKSGTSQTTKAARILRAKRRVSLTGTPIENHLGDLWSQLEFLNPGMLGASSQFARLGATRGAHDLIDDGRDILSRALRPIMLRRTKEAVLKDLPPKTEQILRAPLTGAQRTSYEELSHFYRTELSKSKGERRKDKLEETGRPTMNVLAALTRLRQCACHPGLIDKTLLSERSGKLDLVLPMLEELTAAGKKALVFSSFTGLLGLMRTRLETAHVPYLSLDGGTRDRASLVERFQSAEGGQVFLISIKAGGAGLNLTAADYVFLLDPWWNPAVEAQAIDRAHRIGRTRPVHVYRVLTEDTVETRVVELQESKRDLAGEILEGAVSSPSKLAASDLAFLLG